MLNHHRLLRIFILTDVFCVVAGVAVAIIFEGTLPEPLRTHVATQELHPFILIAGVVLLVLLITAWVGLWRSASWAPAVYAVTWFGCLVMVPFSGPYIGTGIEEMFDFAGSAAGGGILSLLFLARDGGGGSRWGGLLREVLNDSGPRPSDEVIQPHVKSSRVHRALSWLYGLIALMLSVLPFIASTGEEALRPAELAIASTIPLFFFAIAVLHHFVSRGAKERKRWARIGSIVFACLLVPAVPVGTIIGLYLLRNRSWEPPSVTTGTNRA